MIETVGRRIAISYPQLLKRFMETRGIAYKICLLGGAVEVVPCAGLADAVCDLVSSGATLEANGLREVETVYRSNACLIQRAGAFTTETQALATRLLTTARSRMAGGKRLSRW